MASGQASPNTAATGRGRVDVIEEESPIGFVGVSDQNGVPTPNNTPKDMDISDQQSISGSDIVINSNTKSTAKSTASGQTFAVPEALHDLIKKESDKILSEAATDDGNPDTVASLLSSFDKAASSTSSSTGPSAPRSIKVSELTEDEKNEIDQNYGHWIKQNLQKSDQKHYDSFMGTLPESKQILAKYYFIQLPEHDRYGCTAVVSNYATKFEEYENLSSKSGSLFPCSLDRN